jgi:hypothetical protein
MVPRKQIVNRRQPFDLCQPLQKVGVCFSGFNPAEQIALGPRRVLLGELKPGQCLFNLHGVASLRLWSHSCQGGTIVQRSK